MLSNVVKNWKGLMGIGIGRTPTLVISSPTIAHDLLSTTNFSTRPRSVVFGELFMKMASIIAIPYGSYSQLYYSNMF
jgi:hypothetical protein